MLKSINLAHVLHKKCIHKSLCGETNNKKKSKMKKKKDQCCMLNTLTHITSIFLNSLLQLSSALSILFFFRLLLRCHSELMVYWWWWDDDDDILYKTALREFNRHQAQNRLDYDFIQTIYSNLIFSIHLQLYTNTIFLDSL